MKTVIDRTEEKMKLAQELGLVSYLNEKTREQEKKAAIQQLTGMNFSPINHEQIKEKICKVVFDKESLKTQDRHGIWLVITSIVAGIAFIAGIAAKISASLPAVSWAELLSFEIVVVAAFLGSQLFHIPFLFRKTIVRKCWLKDWFQELPYGALLAVKEAKEKGIEGFVERTYGETSNRGYMVYYPAYASTQDRVKADPVITGMYKGVEVEIFAWDDSKVHE